MPPCTCRLVPTLVLVLAGCAPATPPSPAEAMHEPCAPDRCSGSSSAIDVEPARARDTAAALHACDDRTSWLDEVTGA